MLQEQSSSECELFAFLMRFHRRRRRCHLSKIHTLMRNLGGVERVGMHRMLHITAIRIDIIAQSPNIASCVLSDPTSHSIHLLHLTFCRGAAACVACVSYSIIYLPSEAPPRSYHELVCHATARERFEIARRRWSCASDTNEQHRGTSAWI